MKSRIIGFLIVLCVLATLFVLTEGSNTTQVPTSLPSSSDADFKGLTIN